MSEQNIKVLDFDSTNITVFNEFQKELAKIQEENKSLTFDYASEDGSKQAKSHIAKIRKCKTKVSAIHKEAKAEALNYGRKLDKTKNKLLETIEEMIDVHAEPLRIIEEREAERKSKHREFIESIKNYSHLINDGESRSSSRIKEIINEVMSIEVNDSLEEFFEEAEMIKPYVISKLTEYYNNTKKQEEERLQKEQQEKERIEREARIAKEAEEKAKAEAEAELKRIKDEMERQRIEAEQAKIREAEAQELAKKQAEADNKRKQLEMERQIEEQKLAARQAEERAIKAKQDAVEEAKRNIEIKEKQEAEDLRKREADKKHKSKINNEILDAFIKEGIPEDCAKKVIIQVAKKSVPHIVINY